MWEYEQNYTAKVRKPPHPSQSSSASKKSPAGALPAPLSEVAGRQDKVVRHVVEDLGEFAPLVQILDLPVPQTVDNVADALRILDFPIAEQVIEVPHDLLFSVSFSFSPFLSRSQRNSWWKCPPCCLPSASPCGSRNRSLTLQFLVVVVKVLSPGQSTTATSSSLERIPERTVEQIVDISSPGDGLGRGSALALQTRILLGGFSHFSPLEKVRSAGQVVSAKLGGHVSSSTLSAHQMARARRARGLCWFRRVGADLSPPTSASPVTGTDVPTSPLGTCRWVLMSSGSGSSLQEEMYVTGTRSLGLTVHTLPPLPPG